MDAGIVKRSVTGSLQWSDTYTEGTARFFSVAVGPDGLMAAAGEQAPN